MIAHWLTEEGRDLAEVTDAMVELARAFVSE
jgi:DNA-binding HxlR family transcriptional regulator